MKPINSIQEAIQVLKNENVIAHPADTCFGLAGLLESEMAMKKIQTIKGRDAKKPMSIMLPEAKLAYLEDYVILDEFSRKMCQKLLPGPVTLILKKGPKIPAHFFPETNYIGIRIPDDQQVLELLNELGEVIITTSANFSGEATCYDPQKVKDAFAGRKNKPNAILEGEITEKKLPSTVIKIEDQGWEVLREGPVSESEIKRLIK